MDNEQNLLSTILDTVNNVIFIFDLELKNIVYANHQTINFIGYTFEELQEFGENFISEMFHKDDVSKLLTDISEMSTQGIKKYNSDYRFKHKDGNYRWFECNTTPFKYDKTGKLIQILGSAQDISERKNIENKLIKAKELAQENEKFVDTILQTIPYPIDIINAEGKILYQNEILKKEFKTDALGSVCWEIYRNNKAQCEDCPLKREIKLGETSRCYSEGALNNRTFEISHTEILFKGQIALLEIFHDITEIKKNQNELIAAKEKAEISQERLITYINSIPDIICYKDGEGRWLLANDADLELFYLQGVDYLGKTDLDLSLFTNELYKNAFENCMATDEEAWQKKIMSKGIEIIPTVSGINKVFDVYKVPVFHPNGTRKGLAVIGREVTDLYEIQKHLIAAKEKAEENNKINEIRLRLIKYSENHSIDQILEETLNECEKITKSKIGFFHFVDSDQKTLILQNWSTQTKEHFCKAFGKGEHYSVDKAGIWVECLSEKKPVIHNNYQALLNKKGLPEGHAPIIRELTVPIAYNDVIKAIIGMGNKATDYNQNDVENVSLIAFLAWEIIEKKKITEALIFAKEKAEEANRLKMAFLNNMSHEIRTPLNAISGFSQLITMPEQSTEKLEQYAEFINQSSDKLINIITDVVEISEISTRQTIIKNTEFKIKELLSEIEKVFVRMAKEKQVEFIFCNLETVEDFKINSDYEKLKRILMHLIDNALKFTIKGKVEIKCTLLTNDLQFIISDTGIGILPNMQSVIFEPFRQVETGNTRNFGGNGLGLSIAKAYTELLKGSILIHSQINHGTTVYLTVPHNSVHKKTEEDYVPKSHRFLSKHIVGESIGESNSIHLSKQFTPPPPPPRKKNVLIVEDEYLNYQYLLELLSQANIDVLYASNGQKAVDLCQANPQIDLVLMDIKMPIMDGYKATKIIKSFRPFLTIIAQTAYATENEQAQFINVFDDYITKPINKHGLKQKLSKYIEFL